MSTPIGNPDLTQQAPHSPRERFGGFVILARTVDKCRAAAAGKIGEYHYDCPLDNQLFSFKGINGEQFKRVVSSFRNYEDVAAWLVSNGTPKTSEEIKAWSDKAEQTRLRDVPALQDPSHHQEVWENCRKLGMNFDTAALFDWLEADDGASFPSPAKKAA
jgi:hypothetical protein